MEQIYSMHLHLKMVKQCLRVLKRSKCPWGVDLDLPRGASKRQVDSLTNSRRSYPNLRQVICQETMDGQTLTWKRTSGSSSSLTSSFRLGRGLIRVLLCAWLSEVRSSWSWECRIAGKSNAFQLEVPRKAQTSSVLKEKVNRKFLNSSAIRSKKSTKFTKQFLIFHWAS